MVGPLAPEFRIFPGLAQASLALAEELTTRTLRAQSLGLPFRWVIPGGETPRTLFSLLAERFRDRIPWSSIHLFWSDERWVPHDHPESNYRLAATTLLKSHLIQPPQVHPIPTDLASPELAAVSYERLLRKPMGGLAPSPYLLDLAILGVGPDGHTASLFPDSPVLRESERFVRGVPDSPTSPHVARVTLTLPAFQRTRQVFFLASGATKREVVERVRADFRTAVDRFPAARVQSTDPVVWFVDTAATGASA